MLLTQIRSRMALAATILLALAAWTLMPRGFEAARLVAAADDPVRLADIGLDRDFTADVAVREIDTALAGEDADLAESFVALADARGVAIPPVLRARVEAANTAAATAVHVAGKFVDGFVVGSPNDLAGLAGAVAGDLFVYGDLRDVARETLQFARGEKADELILGLACVGLAVTAGTYATFGAGAPTRVGVSLIKFAGKSGRMTRAMTDAVIRPLRAVVDTAALKAAFRPRTLLQPAVAVREVRAAVKMEKAQGLVRVLADAGRIHAKAGTRAALDGLRVAQGPKDVARLAKLADVKGGQTRAVLKVLGRGAIVLGGGLFQLASWIFWALLNLIALVVALKSTTERATWRFLHWRKRVRARRLAIVCTVG